MIMYYTVQIDTVEPLDEDILKLSQGCPEYIV